MKNKTVATLLALFLGGFGIHKFYLGDLGWGVLYILFSWTPFPWITAFVEFLILLINSEDAFNARYNSIYRTSQTQPISEDRSTTVVINMGDGDQKVVKTGAKIADEPRNQRLQSSRNSQGQLPSRTQPANRQLQPERLDIRILKICRAENGATMSDCVIETGAELDDIEKTLEILQKKHLITVDNRTHDGAVIYRSV